MQAVNMITQIWKIDLQNDLKTILVSAGMLKIKYAGSNR